MVAPNSVVATQEKTVEQKKEMLAVLMSNGKRDYVSGNFSGACEKLGEAVELSVEIHGDFAADSFEPHFYYGKAMLELGRAQDDVLDNAMKDLPVPDELDESADEEQYGNPDNLTEEEKNDIREKVGDALVEANSDESAEQPAEQSEKSAEDSESPVKPDSTSESVEKPFIEVKESFEKSAEAGVPEVTTETEPSVEKVLSEEAPPAEEAVCDDMEAEDGPADNEDNEDGDGEEDEEATEAQIAWEVLEVARKICEAQEQNKDWELKKADVLLELADCSITNEKYQDALDDLNLCLELQKKHLEASDRRFAQTYIGMARAYRLNDDFDNAAKFYKQTKEAIVAKLASVEAKEQKDKDDEEEIKELKMIVEDLDLKIEDAIESGKQTEENLNKIREQIGLKTVTNVLCEKTSDPAGDITNLVRKPVKRPAETEVAPEDPKRAKEDTAADDAATTTA